MSDWPQKCLAEVCTVVAGQSPEGTAYNDRGNGLPFYQGKKEFTDRYLAPPSTWTSSITKRALPDDILMSVRAPVGPINVTRQEICIGRGLAAIRASSKIDNGFLWYALLWLQPKIVGNAGAVFPSINKKQIEALPLPIPPLNEQKRIVAVLDQAFAALDGARALAEENLADAEELFENVLEQRLSGLYQTYPVRRLIDLCGERGVTYGVIKLGDHIPDGVPCLRTSNVRRLAIETDGMKRITTSLSNEYKRTILKGGEVLVNVRGTLGGVAVVPPEMAGWNVSREVAMVDIVGVNPSYISYSIATKRAQSWLTGVTKGAAYKGINLTDLRELEIPAVDGELQERLVAELNDLERTCASVAASFQNKLRDIDHLRQCLLQKAFAGELT